MCIRDRFCAWLLMRVPDTRILVLAGGFALAKKMVRNVKRIIERHPPTAHLRPRRTHTGGADQLTVPRQAELREPPMVEQGRSLCYPIYAAGEHAEDGVTAERLAAASPNKARPVRFSG